MSISHAEALSLFTYDPSTGILRRRKTVASRAVEGSIAGSLNSEGYLHVKVGRSNIKVHRLVWLMHHGSWPDGVIDHINRNRADNRISNLRDTTVLQNNLNCNVRSDSKTGVPGVTWHARDKKYCAATKHSGRTRHLGSYPSIEAATAALMAFKAELGRRG